MSCILFTKIIFYTALHLAQSLVTVYKKADELWKCCITWQPQLLNWRVWVFFQPHVQLNVVSGAFPVQLFSASELNACFLWLRCCRTTCSKGAYPLLMKRSYIDVDHANAGITWWISVAVWHLLAYSDGKDGVVLQKWNSNMSDAGIECWDLFFQWFYISWVLVHLNKICIYHLTSIGQTWTYNTLLHPFNYVLLIYFSFILLNESIS